MADAEHRQQFRGLGKSLELPKACKDLCTSQESFSAQLQALITERWELQAFLQPMAGIRKASHCSQQKQGASLPPNTRGDARSPQICPSSLNYPRAKQPVSRGPGTIWLPMLLSSATPQISRCRPHCHTGCQDAASATTGSGLGGWKHTSGRETADPPSKGETTASCHRLPRRLCFTEPPTSAPGTARSSVGSLQPLAANTAQQEQG